MNTNEANAVSATVPALIIGIVIVVVSLLSLGKVDNYLHQKAVNECAQTARYERVDAKSGIKAVYPIPDQYKTCLKDKGY